MALYWITVLSGATLVTILGGWWLALTVVGILWLATACAFYDIEALSTEKTWNLQEIRRLWKTEPEILVQRAVTGAWRCLSADQPCVTRRLPAPIAVGWRAVVVVAAAAALYVWHKYFVGLGRAMVDMPELKNPEDRLILLGAQLFLRLMQALSIMLAFMLGMSARSAAAETVRSVIGSAAK
jgi:hypothetical protein